MSGKENVVLSFCKKLFTACVSLANYNLLQTKLSDIDKTVTAQEKIINDLKDEVQSKKDLLKAKDEEIISLRDELIDSEVKAKAKLDSSLVVQITEKTMWEEEKNTLLSKIKVLESRVAGAENIEKAVKEKLKEIEDKLKEANRDKATIGTDLTIAYADLKAVKGKLSKAEVDLTIFKEKLEIEAARKEIKSSRGNSALKKEEVLRVVSLRESNKGIVAIAKEMDLTIDSVENILNGISYTRWTNLPRL